MSPGLKRAREPYRVKNAIVGLALGAFAVGVWAYSISAVKQDVFDDVDEEVGALAASSDLANSSSNNIPTTTSILKADIPSIMKHGALRDSIILQEAAKVEAKANTPARGVLRHIEHRAPWLLDPERKTLVWGAPPVDNIGKMSKS
jgi:cytochrome c oxidase assembly factor 3